MAFKQPFPVDGRFFFLPDVHLDKGVAGFQDGDECARTGGNHRRRLFTASVPGRCDRDLHPVPFARGQDGDFERVARVDGLADFDVRIDIRVAGAFEGFVEDDLDFLDDADGIAVDVGRGVITAGFGAGRVAGVLIVAGGLRRFPDDGNGNVRKHAFPVEDDHDLPVGVADRVSFMVIADSIGSVQPERDPGTLP